MGLFNFGKKEDPIKGKQDSLKRFDSYAKSLILSDKGCAFFLLTSHLGFEGKAMMGTVPQIENMFCQLFESYPEIMTVLEGIIQKYKNGTAVYRKDGKTQQISDGLREAAMSVTNRPINDTSSFTIENNPEEILPKPKSIGNKEEDIMNGLVNTLMGGKKDIEKQNEKDFKVIKDKLYQDHEKFQKGIRDKGLSDYNIDDIIKRVDEN